MWIDNRPQERGEKAGLESASMTRPIDLSALHAAFKRGEYAAVLEALLPAFNTYATNEMAQALNA
ncbi:MAG: hypothetical protein KIS89_08330, partial [Dokdonella sp.]|nr:hypothetical protein [Dokdonella sp.]